MNQLRTQQEIDYRIQQKRCVIYYYTIWCGTCEYSGPEMFKISQTYQILPFYKVDVDTIDNVEEKMNLYGVPNIKFYFQGKEVNQIVGFDEKRVKFLL